MSPDLAPFASWREVMKQRAKDPSAALVDTRWYWDRSGRQAWEAGHVPGAVFVDLTEDLSGPVTPTSGRQPLPEPEDFAAAMSRAGIDGNHPVFAYDDAGGVIAARLVWMLRSVGVPAAVISGGIAAFDGELRAGEESPTVPVVFQPRPWPEELNVDTEHVAHAMLEHERPQLVLVDARPENRYRGEEPEVDPRLGVVPQADPRGGHIPTAVNVPCRANLDSHGRIKSPEELRDAFAQAGIDAANITRVVSYCGSGVTACHNLLALEYAGLEGAKLYPGSWSAWSRSPKLPVARS